MELNSNPLNIQPLFFGDGTELKFSLIISTHFTNKGLFTVHHNQNSPITSGKTTAVNREITLHN